MAGDRIGSVYEQRRPDPASSLVPANLIALELAGMSPRWRIACPGPSLSVDFCSRQPGARAGMPSTAAWKSFIFPFPAWPSRRCHSVYASSSFSCWCRFGRRPGPCPGRCPGQLLLAPRGRLVGKGHNSFQPSWRALASRRRGVDMLLAG